MKKSLLLITLIFLSLNFLSAAYYGGLSGFLYRFDQQTILIVGVFIISFALLHFSLARVFKDSKVTSGVIAFTSSLLITYWTNRQIPYYGISTYWFTDITYWFKDLGFFGTIIVLGLTAYFIYLVYKDFKQKNYK